MLDGIQKWLDELAESQYYDSQIIEAVKPYVERCTGNHGIEKPAWLVKPKRSQVQEMCGMRSHKNMRKKTSKKTGNNELNKSKNTTVNFEDNV
ncbi:hypothetical protein PVK06_021171 [Gossypium arboreum]|uniref:Uncharacterized protein n=1 Tax=Gossypium arboreum TaxID=29729 RepID=A0ABR0PPS6_GOSAR|nr:hypothetical protein PVK06_021171 [Gossypium arboreum]